MKALGILAAALMLVLGMTSMPEPAHAQLFRRDPAPEPTYRAPSRQYVNPRRQYVPEQPEQPRRRGFLERLFGGFDRDENSPRFFDRQRRIQQQQPPPREPDVAAPAAPRVPKTVFVALLGDSLAENLAPGLSDALAERPEVGIVRQIRSGQGLLKEAKESWRQSADEVLARTPPVAAAVVFVGPTDDPPKPAKKTADDAPPGPVLSTLPWMDEYAAKVDEITLAFRQKGIPLLWVGMPPVADPQTMAEYAALNELVRQRVVSLGGTFIDVWEGFVNEDEEYTVQGPNIEGRQVRLRMADGLHFTRAGARKLGHYIELELRSVLTPADQNDSVADLGVDPSLPTTPGHSRILVLGQAPRTPGAVLVPPAPPAAAKPAPSGQQTFNPGILAGAEGSAPMPQTATVADETKPEQNALVTGAAIPPKPGRADDFAWPQTAAN